MLKSIIDGASPMTRWVAFGVSVFYIVVTLIVAIGTAVG